MIYLIKEPAVDGSQEMDIVNNMSGYWDDFEDYGLEGSDNDFDEFLEECIKVIDEEFRELNDDFFPAHIGKENARKLYDLVREVRPGLVVETGVANGLSTSSLLKALDDNDRGDLFSIDLPVTAEREESSEGRKGAVIPPGRTSGWAIPTYLRDRWTLRQGNTYYELPKLLEELSEIEIFLHDSGHSYETMMFEYTSAWYHLREDGFILSDNISRNSAFRDFSEAEDLQRYRLGELGLLKK